MAVDDNTTAHAMAAASAADGIVLKFLQVHIPALPLPNLC